MIAEGSEKFRSIHIYIYNTYIHTYAHIFSLQRGLYTVMQGVCNPEMVIYRLHLLHRVWGSGRIKKMRVQGLRLRFKEWGPETQPLRYTTMGY